MPALPFESKETVPAAEMSMTRVPPSADQASESWRLRAEAGHVLGAGGETRAFGKLNFDPHNDDPAAAYSVAGASSPLFYNKANMAVDPTMGGDRNLLTRAVASSQLDQHLGLNILAEEKFGRNTQGRLMGVSVQVDGAGMTGKYDVQRGGEEVEVHGFLGLTPGDTGHTPSAALQNANLPDHVKGYAQPNIQKGLSDLEVMDYISGQIDRHPGNIFINPETGQVKGIDNDLAFPEQERSVVLGGDKALRQKMIPTIPMTIHQDTAAKIAAIDVNEMVRMLENVTRPDGEPGLSQPEIARAANRLYELQGAIANPASVPGFQVVAEFNDETFLQSVEAQKATFQNQHDGVEFDAMTGDELSTAYRSSYVGAMLMAEKEKTFAIELKPETNAIRPANTIPPVARDAQYVEFAKMVQAAQRTLKADPQLIDNADARQHATNLKQQIADAKAKIAHYDKETAGLENKKVGSMLRSLASGGREGRKEFYAEKKTAAQQQLASLERELNRTVANAVPDNMRQGLHADAGQIVQAQQNVAQNRAYLNGPAPQPAGPRPAVQMALPAVEQMPAPKQAPLPKNAEDELDMPDLDDDDDIELDSEAEVKAEVKQEGLAKKPSVGDMLRRTSSAPALGGHRQGQGQGQGQGEGQEGPKPAGNSLRASGGWQPSAKPAGAKPGGAGSHSAAHK